MKPLLTILALLLCAAAGAGTPPRTASDPPAPTAPAADPTPAASGAVRTDAAEATLMLANRPIATFRVSFGGLTPSARVARALQRIDEMESGEGSRTVDEVPFQLEGRRGIALRAGNGVLFAITDGDLEPGGHADLETAASQAKAALAQSLQAMRAQRQWPTLLAGAGVVVAATLGLALGLHLLTRTGRALRTRLADWAAATRHATGGIPGVDAPATGGRWVGYGGALLERLLQLVVLLLIGLLFFLWIEAVLYAFPTTAPIARRLNDAFGDAAWKLLDGASAAIPGLLVASLILVLARGAIEVADAVFRSVRERRLQLPGMHPETAEATRKLVVIGVWAFALVAVYPYLPGSDSAVFKGVSVLIGAMVTLGSTGVANQLMSGLVLVYSRALRRGDYVSIGETEGVVAEVGTLATKIRTMRNEEVTIPNAVLVANPIRNYSKMAGDQGTMISTRVTIGYDAPWRQVHALLVLAASRTPGLRSQPAPYVYQRALSDFYVEYELFVFVDRPIERIPMLSTLHAQIQDAFNEAGVQIMSPHFLGQPAQAVVVPKAAWDPPPAGGA